MAHFKKILPADLNRVLSLVLSLVIYFFLITHSHLYLDYLNLKLCRRAIFTYATLISISIIFKSIAKNLTEGEVQSLPFEAWYPIKIDSPFKFWLSYYQQLPPSIIASLAHPCIDGMYIAFLLQVIHQFKILGHRFKYIDEYVQKSAFKRKELIVQYVKRLRSIYR